MDSKELPKGDFDFTIYNSSGVAKSQFKKLSDKVFKNFDKKPFTDLELIQNSKLLDFLGMCNHGSRNNGIALRNEIKDLKEELNVCSNKIHTNI